MRTHASCCAKSSARRDTASTPPAVGKRPLEIGKAQLFDVIISDMRLGPSLNGLDVLRAYKAIQPESEVILITAFGSMETAIEAVKAGAFDYISKPFKIDEVLLAGPTGPGEPQTAARES